MTPGATRPFTVIGENIHVTRTVRSDSPRVGTTGGQWTVAFTDRDGSPQAMPLIDPIVASAEFGQGKVKHMRNAFLLGLAGDGVVGTDVAGAVSAEMAEIGREYLLAAARRQEEAGATYLDVNVDEIADEPARCAAAMDWIVRLLEPASGVPLALDSSSTTTLAAGCRASTGRCGTVLLNSASPERPDVLELAAEFDAPVVLSAAGSGLLPSTATARLENARTILEAARSLWLPADWLFVDLLVVPIGVEPGAGAAYLDAARRVRADCGAAIRITGGLSNISFGLPNRRLLNDVFLALALDAGVDSGILDPLVTQVDAVRGMDRDAEPFRIAAATLTGSDAFAIDYLTAHRAGRLAAAGAAS